MSDDQSQSQTPAQEPGTPKPEGGVETDAQSVQGSVHGSVQGSVSGSVPGSVRGPGSVQGSQLEGGRPIQTFILRHCIVILLVVRMSPSYMLKKAVSLTIVDIDCLMCT